MTKPDLAKLTALSVGSPAESELIHHQIFTQKETPAFVAQKGGECVLAAAGKEVKKYGDRLGDITDNTTLFTTLAEASEVP